MIKKAWPQFIDEWLDRRARQKEYEQKKQDYDQSIFGKIKKDKANDNIFFNGPLSGAAVGAPLGALTGGLLADLATSNDVSPALKLARILAGAGIGGITGGIAGGFARQALIDYASGKEPKLEVVG